MTEMPDGRDHDWARGLLEQYREALDELLTAGEPFDERRYDPALSRANRLNPVAWQIVKDLLPDVAEYDHNLGYSSQARDQKNDVDRALGVLELQQELEEHWPSEPSMTLDSSQLHPWVWDPAKELWEIGRYAEGLQVAALTVNARTQEKLGRSDLEFTPLARDAFSPNPPIAGCPRLRVVEFGDVDEETWKNYHLGAASLGEYLFRRWRNVTAHNEPEEIIPQAANEALGAMSIYARMVDLANVEGDRRTDG